MAEILPVKIDRQWLKDTAASPTRRLLPARQRMLLALGAGAMLLAGAAAGLLAWYQPLEMPLVMVVSAAPPQSAGARRELALEQDAAAIAADFTVQHRRLHPQLTSVASELQASLAILRMAQPRECVVLYINGVVGSYHEELALWGSEAAASMPDGMVRLTELLDAIDNCRAQSTFVLFDVHAARADSDTFPLRNLSAALDEELRGRKFDRARIMTARSPGEEAALLPSANQSLFGHLVQRGIRGAADGADHTVTNGRVSSEELCAFVQQQLPRLAGVLAGAVQTPRCYGRGMNFEVAVAHERLDKDKVEVANEYPKWLTEAWTAFQQAAELDEDGWTDWNDRLHRAEFVAMLSPHEAAIKEAQAELAKLAAEHKPAAASAIATNDFATSLRQYLVQRAQVIATTPADKAQAATQKLLADFIKAQAAHEKQVNSAVVAVANDPADAKVEHWQALVELLDAWPKLSATDATQSLRALLALRQSSPGDEQLAAVACKALKIAAKVDALQQDATTWNWNRALIERLLEQRVHAETLLFARDFVKLEAAAQAYDDCDSQADPIEECVRQLETSMVKVQWARRFLQTHRELAEGAVELSNAWGQSAEALSRLERLLAPPAQPLASAGDATTLARSLSQACVELDIAAEPLIQLTKPDHIARVVEACRASGADARDLQLAAVLFSASNMAPVDRERLWQAYLPLAARLPAAACPDSTELTSGDRFDAQQRMHQDWQLLAEQSDCPRPDPAAIGRWRDDWRRYRQAELARLNSPETALWSVGGLDLVGPFSCPALSRATPSATFSFLVQPRGGDIQDVIIGTQTPRGLNASTTGRIDATGLAKFQLDLSLTPGQMEDARGFLAVVQFEGRRFHAPIRFPQLEESSEANIWLSSSATQLQPLEQIDLIGTTSAFVWIENSAATPRNLAVSVAGIPTPTAVSLAPREVKCVPLPPLAAPLTTSEIAIFVHGPNQQLLTKRVVTMRSPRTEDLVSIVGGQIQNDAQQGIVASIALERLPGVELEVPVQLVVDRAPIVNGRTSSVLTSQQASTTLSAALKVRAGDRMVCRIEVPGAEQPLVLSATVPGSGAASVLTHQTESSISLAGEAISQPRGDYNLQWLAAGRESQTLQITLVPAAGSASPVLSRTVMHHPITATVAATNPPSGLLITPSTVAPAETFDTRGIVGRYVWHADGDVANQKLHAELPVVFDDSPPEACRFMQPPASAAKGSQVTLTVSGWDSLSGIADVALFVGRPVNQQPPPGARLFAAASNPDEPNVFSTAVALPQDLGPCEITARFTNGAGMTTFTSTTINIVASLPPALGEVRGVVLEGSRPQAGLEVSLEKGPAVLVKAKTDEQGAFAFAGVQPGEYVVKASKPLAERKGQAAVTVQAGATATASIKLAL